MSASSSSSGSNVQTSPSINKLPRTPSEWQLYFVLQRANLLQYFDTFISQGGDDVQQLLEAGEEEFLEIMSLVGMASKPLHVRRLQKALHDFSINPGPFQVAAFQKCGLSPPPVATATVSSAATHLIGGLLSGDTFSPGPATSVLHAGAVFGHSVNSALPLTVPNSESPGAMSSHSNGSANIWTHTLPDGLDQGLDFGYSTFSPVLTDAQVQRIADCALNLVRTLPDIEPKLVQNKKKISREIINVMELAPGNGNRLEEFRKYAAIYGRFDAKRKADKPLTLHEVSVNEAAAQICLLKPALLTRRDELFPLARQIVRDAGYHYVKQPGMNSRLLYRGDLDDYESMRKRASPTESIESLEDSPNSSRSNLSEQCPNSGGLLSDLRCCSSDGSLFVKTKKKRCLEEIGEEMQRINREQDSCKRRVCEAQDLTELHAIHRDLQRLTKQQMELSNEQAALLGDTTPLPVSSAAEEQSMPRLINDNSSNSTPNIKLENDLAANDLPPANSR